MVKYATYAENDPFWGDQLSEKRRFRILPSEYERKCPDKMRTWLIVHLLATSEECSYSFMKRTHPERIGCKLYHTKSYLSIEHNFA